LNRHLKFIAIVPAIAFAGTLAVSHSALAYAGEKYAKEAKITLPEARNIALKARPGKITDEELEKERGGTGLRYSFDVKSAGATYEVGVDARTGKVLEDKKEGPHPD
jgi:uncharacterized membrane protein YkoI